MKKLKYLFAVLFIGALAAVIALLLNQTPEAPKDGIFTYSIDGGNATIERCDITASGEISVPSTLGEYPVISIGDYAFDGCSQITDIILPEGITTIQTYAFENCANLKSIRIPKSVISIDRDAFSNCPKLSGIWVSAGNKNYCSDTSGVLYSADMTILLRAPMALADPYTIPASVQNIGDRAFSGCVNLLDIIIPSGITNLDWYAFSNCTQLESITLPDTITYIGHDVFRGCGNLEYIFYKGSEAQWDALVIKSGNNALSSANITFNFCIHVWSEGTVTREPTCRDAGVRTYVCALCNNPRVEAIPKLSEHTWDEGYVLKSPTCQDYGVHTYSCIVCKATKKENIEKLTTHTWSAGIATKEPTCCETGIMTYTCNFCGEVREDVIAMLTSHTPGDPATETTDQVCTICGIVLVPATGVATEPPTEPPTEPDLEESGGSFFDAITDFFASIGQFFEDLFASIAALFGG